MTKRDVDQAALEDSKGGPHEDKTKRRERIRARLDWEPDVPFEEWTEDDWLDLEESLGGIYE